MFKLKTTLGTNNICGPNLIRIRHEKGLSQRQLAKNLQIAGYDVDHHFIRRKWRTICDRYGTGGTGKSAAGGDHELD